MYPLFETIRIENGLPQNMDAHQWRLEFSFLKHYQQHCIWNLEEILKPMVSIKQGRLRFSYNANTYFIEESLHTPKEIKHLQIVQNDRIDYSLKYSDRSQLDELYKQRGSSDDVLILKNGLITDTTICNIVFWDGSHWLSPQHPLLKGTMRQTLLNNKVIIERNIYLENIKNYKAYVLINALRTWNPNNKQAISTIRFP